MLVISVLHRHAAPNHSCETQHKSYSWFLKVGRSFPDVTFLSMGKERIHLQLIESLLVFP